MSLTKEKKKAAVDLTNGSVAKGMISFAVPIFLGQLLQQLYNMADAWVVGNFADIDAFAAVSSAGSLIFFITGFFSGISIGAALLFPVMWAQKIKKRFLSRFIPTFCLAYWHPYLPQ